MAHNTRQQHQAAIADASNRVNCEMAENGGSQWDYLDYLRHQRMTGPDLYTGKTKHDII